MNDQVTQYIENAPGEHKTIMQIVRTLIHQNLANLTEEFKWGRPIFRTTKDFSYFVSNKNYVTIGFTRNFEKLQDPKGLLEGTGKTMRHIKIKSASEIDNELLKEWFKIVTSE